MLYPAIIKRIIIRLKQAYLDITIDKEDKYNYKEYADWILRFLELSDEDIKYTINTFEKYQTKSIIDAFDRKDKEIFINQLGVFYIKPTTMVFYNKINELTYGKSKQDINFKDIRIIALDAAKDECIRISDLKKEVKEYGKVGKFEI